MLIKLYPETKKKHLGDLFGLFFEDLNHAADGGLYAELIRNRDFEFSPIDNPSYSSLSGWSEIGHAKVTICDERAPFTNNPHYAVVKASAGCGVCNLGFGEGIPVNKGESYRVILWAKAESPMKLKVRLCEEEISFSLNTVWRRYEAILSPKYTAVSARLSLLAAERGCFSLAFVSLMPLDTFKRRTNGMRKDITQALVEMKPRFLRFPGGCLTHDGQLDPDARDGIYNWKRTLGPVENRPARRNNWVYHQTMGLGFFEYFQLCEDMDCEPLPVVSGGLDPHHLRFAEGELLEMYIQDAVDLIDFAKGDDTTVWGRIRAEMGHPKPFRLNYLAVGNEEIHEEFHHNMALFVKAIRAKDSSIRIVGSAGPFAQGQPYEMGWQYARAQALDYVDEHYYQAPEWFLANCDRYEAYPTDGPKVFLGEYASWGNQMENALAEAAYMTGLQNAPAVGLACYAPMLCHMNYINWRPTMLTFDNHRLCKTVNYHVQSMFMRHQGDWSIPVVTEGMPAAVCQDENLRGALRLTADDNELALTDICLTQGGKTQRFPDTCLSGTDSLLLDETQYDFRLELTVQRKGGSRGLLVRFGQQDEHNFYQWTVGGWSSSDSSVEQRIHNRNSCLTQSSFNFDDQSYQLVMELHGNEIKTFINRREINRIAIKKMVIQPLYLAGSVDEKNGDVILKAVNVLDTAVEAMIDMTCTCYISETLCASPDTENTLDQPDCVVPVIERHPGCERISYCFPGHSVTVLRFTQMTAE